MKRFLTSVMCFVSMAALTVTAVAAPTYTIEPVTNIVTITGSVDVKEGKETTVALQVLRPNKTYENSDPNTIDAVAYVAEDVTENGVYSFSFELADTGLYHAYVDGNELAVDVVDYNENKKAIQDLNAAALISYDEFATFFGNNPDSLLFNYPLYSKVTQSDVLHRIYDAIIETPLDPEDGYTVSDFFKATTVIVALNEGNIKNIGDFAKEMSVTTGEMKDWYAKSCVTDSVKTAVTSRISNKNIDDMDEFNNLFKEALILEIIKNPGTSANIKPLITEFADDIGVDADDITDSTYLEIAGENFKNYDDLRLALEEDNNGGGSSGGGGGSGYASGGGIGGSVSLPNISAAVGTSTIKGFVDLDGVQWAKDAITELADMNIVSYNDEKKFLPYDNVTREQFVKLLVTLFNLKADGSELPFTDVKSGDWFYPYVAAAYQSGLCRGISETEFGSGLFVKRQDIAVMVDRALESRGKTLEQMREPLNFVDGADIDSYAVGSVNNLCGAGILNGNENVEFLPKSNATRAEAAVIIHKLIKYAK